MLNLLYLFKIINNIIDSGYPELFDYKLFLIEGKFYSDEKKEKEFDIENKLMEFEEILNKQKLLKKDIYNKYVYLNLIYGKYFRDIYLYTTNSNKNYKLKINYLNKYLLNNKFKNQVNYKIKENEKNENQIL